MKLIERDFDVITGSPNIEHLDTLENVPVFMGCVDHQEALDLRQDIAWWISRESGLIQLKKLLPLDVLYPESHGAGAIGALWGKHHKAFAKFLNQSTPTSIFEVGGAHGILALEYRQFDDIPWTILEPNPAPTDGCEAHFIKGFFDEHFKYSDHFDTVVHSHVFEHIYNPDEFMAHLSGFMSPGKKLVFSLPNMQVMLERKYTNCLNFEHTVYLSEDYIEYLLTNNGFKVVEKSYYLDDHSIFYAAIKETNTPPTQLNVDLYTTNRNLYLAYIEHHKELIFNINNQLSKIEVEDVFLFGAHVQSQYMIGFGLDVSKIKCILDNDSNKHGKRLYGTDMMVASPNILKNLHFPLIIVRAGTFTEEIVTQIKEINPTSIFAV
jgi:SAM-dependent methyltransferase